MMRLERSRWNLQVLLLLVLNVALVLPAHGAERDENKFADGLIQPVTRAEGYDYLRLDADSAKKSFARAVDVGPHFSDYLIIYNFVDHSTPEHAKYSDMQTGLLETALGDLAPDSKAKRIMLVDIDVTSYPVDYAVFFGHNTLGPDGGKIENFLRPYGVVQGSGLIPDEIRLFNFALMNGVKNDVDLQENAKSIYVRLAYTIEGYKQRAEK